MPVLACPDDTAETRYVYDGQNVVFETDDLNAPVAVYTLAIANQPQTHLLHDPLVQPPRHAAPTMGPANPAEYGKLISQRKLDLGLWIAIYHHFDALGSTMALTDDTEMVTDTYLYLPFGEVTTLTGTTENVFTWVGELGYQRDLIVDDYHLRRREYDQRVGGFLSPDPLYLTPHATAYPYAENDPVNAVDPSGFKGWFTNYTEGFDIPKSSINSDVPWLTKSFWAATSEFMGDIRPGARVTGAMKRLEAKRDELLIQVSQLGETIKVAQAKLEDRQALVEKWTAEGDPDWTTTVEKRGDFEYVRVTLNAAEQQKRNQDYLEEGSQLFLDPIIDDPSSSYNKARARVKIAYEDYLLGILDAERAFRDYSEKVPVPHYDIQELQSYFFENHSSSVGSLRPDQEFLDKLQAAGNKTATVMRWTNDLRDDMYNAGAKAQKGLAAASIVVGGAHVAIKTGVVGVMKFAGWVLAGYFVIGPALQRIQKKLGISDEAMELGFIAWNLFGVRLASRTAKAKANPEAKGQIDSKKPINKANDAAADATIAPKDDPITVRKSLDQLDAEAAAANPTRQTKFHTTPPTERGIPVVESMKAKDIEKKILLPDGYMTNPTARSPADSITRPKTGLNPPGRAYNPYTGKLESGEYMYVVDMDGKVIIGNRQGTINGREYDFPHPSLIGGLDPNVQAAGKVWFERGQVVRIDNDSGHFQPGVYTLSKAKRAFEKLGPGAFDPGRVKFLDHVKNPVVP